VIINTYFCFDNCPMTVLAASTCFICLAMHY